LLRSRISERAFGELLAVAPRAARILRTSEAHDDGRAGRPASQHRNRSRRNKGTALL
jgi:hypothetical protein